MVELISLCSVLVTSGFASGFLFGYFDRLIREIV